MLDMISRGRLFSMCWELFCPQQLGWMLVREVFHFHKGKQRAVGGCLLFLQGEEEISERQKREKELGGYGSEELPSKKKQHYMEFPQYRDHSNGLPIITESTGIGHGPLR
ncbi:hypothetical protein PHAVU_007G105266 [Phaseolus vulgaris]|uniref:uncharacterized protein n=1 Tax=Phaseolus vulgaris TaxID=3885 RepID=UPI0035CAB775